MNYDETKINNDKQSYYQLNKLPTDNLPINQFYLYPSVMQNRLGLNNLSSSLPNFINSHIRGGNCSHIHGNIVHSHKCTPYPHIHPNGDMKTYQLVYPQLSFYNRYPSQSSLYNEYPYPTYNTNQYPSWIYENEAIRMMKMRRKMRRKRYKRQGYRKIKHRKNKKNKKD